MKLCLNMFNTNNTNLTFVILITSCIKQTGVMGFGFKRVWLFFYYLHILVQHVQHLLIMLLIMFTYCDQTVSKWTRKPSTKNTNWIYYRRWWTINPLIDLIYKTDLTDTLCSLQGPCLYLQFSFISFMFIQSLTMVLISSFRLQIRSTCPEHMVRGWSLQMSTDKR